MIPDAPELARPPAPPAAAAGRAAAPRWADLPPEMLGLVLAGAAGPVPEPVRLPGVAREGQRAARALGGGVL